MCVYSHIFIAIHTNIYIYLLNSISDLLKIQQFARYLPKARISQTQSYKSLRLTAADPVSVVGKSNQ